ncbi:MAG: NERD domain-containing protein [Gammaproteobacteria bacterium]|nr:NERD domain-containing protein [Gammaproteobacteria bacterium]
MPNTKSPLKAPPLRNPGQSLEKEIIDVVFNEILEKSSIVLIMGFLLFIESLHYFTGSTPNPITPAFIFVLACIYSIPKIIKAKRKLKSLKQGRDGEKAVGQYLDSLRSDGFEILHDVVGGEFNLDHIIISEQGIYTVETKTYSKPDKGKSNITYKDGHIFKNGADIGDNIVIQAKAQSGWLKELLKDMLGKDYEVKPIITFPGWYVETDKSELNTLWALNPKGIGQFIKNQPASLTKEQKKTITYHLSRFVRNTPL